MGLDNSIKPNTSAEQSVPATAVSWGQSLQTGEQSIAEVLKQGLDVKLGDSLAKISFSPASDLGPGVWISSQNLGFADYGLEIVSAVLNLSDKDLRAVVAELETAINAEADMATLVDSFKTSPEGTMAVALDLGWEVSAPLSKLLSPVSGCLSYLGGEVIASGFAEEVRALFTQYFIPYEGLRIGEPGLDVISLRQALAADVFKLADKFLPQGRDAVLKSVMDPTHAITVDKLIETLTNEIVSQFEGKQVLLMEDPLG